MLLSLVFSFNFNFRYMTNKNYKIKFTLLSAVGSVATVDSGIVDIAVGSGSIHITVGSVTGSITGGSSDIANGVGSISEGSVSFTNIITIPS